MRGADALSYRKGHIAEDSGYPSTTSPPAVQVFKSIHLQKQNCVHEQKQKRDQFLSFSLME